VFLTELPLPISFTHNGNDAPQNYLDKRPLASPGLLFGMKQLGFQSMDFHEIRYFMIFRKSVDKITFLLIPDKNDGILHEGLCTFRVISRRNFLTMRNVSDKIYREHQTHIL